MAVNSAFFFRAPASYDEKAVRKHVTAEVPTLLAEACEGLGQLADWSAPAIHALINGLASAKGISLGKLAQPIRLAVCGGTVSPPIDATLAILGREESLLRLRKARELWGAS
jgi:glutamyl-tRNA synthetase